MLVSRERCHYFGQAIALQRALHFTIADGRRTVYCGSIQHVFMKEARI
jgi:hypothetical protein